MVVESESDIEIVTEFFNNTVASWGLRVDHENLYTDEQNHNTASGAGYKHVKWVVYMPAVDEKNKGDYLTLLEVRLATRDTIAKERSTNDPASHDLYDRNRAEQKLVTKLAPPEIGAYRQQYYERDNNPALAMLGLERFKFTPPKPAANTTAEEEPVV